MRRTLVLFVVLFATLFQAVGMARGLGLNAYGDIAHAGLHWQERGHHHHHDGTIHQDESNDSVQHIIADQVNAPSALLAGTGPNLMPPAHLLPLDAESLRLPHPYLDGLLRPPRYRL
jgi:hypothetical protein